MSASSKKKLRKEQEAAAMTEKQKRERQEARKVKAYTWTFAVIMVLVVAVVIGVVATPLINGIIRRSTTAVTIGDHKLSSVDLTYFYSDAVTEYQETVYNQYYSTFGNYWSLMLGFDTTKALNEQSYDETGKTWADFFLDQAIENARSVYALYDDAKAKGYALPEDEQTSINSYFENLDIYATYYGYSSVESWLRNSYGDGANEKNYRTYYEVCALANSYLDKYSKDLTYTVDDYRAYEKDKMDDYDVVSFISFTMKYDSYLGDKEKDENGKEIDWTDAQKEAAREAMKADMEKLMAAEIIDKETFDKAIASLDIYKTEDTSKEDSTNKDDAEEKEDTDNTENTENKTESADTESTDNKDDTSSSNSSSSSSSSSSSTKVPTSTETKRAFYEKLSVSEKALEWLKNKETKTGDISKFEAYTYADHEDDAHVHGDDCGCTRTVDGYTIILFTERDDQSYKMVNVRHILVAFEGGTTANGETTYSDEEKAAAKEKAEELYEQWKAGKANEDSFAELANAESDDQDGKVTNGGLYEDIYKGQMVESFEEWCFAEGRQAGDHGLVETEYGWHIMYFVSYDETSYRDVLIEDDMRTEDTETWHDALVAATPLTKNNLSQIPMDMIIDEE